MLFPSLVFCGEHEYRLIKYLMSNYESSVRPVENASRPLEVLYDVSLHQIIDVDEKNQVLKWNAYEVKYLDFQELYFIIIGQMLATKMA